jgi:hypothetical protein
LKRSALMDRSFALALVTLAALIAGASACSPAHSASAPSVLVPTLTCDGEPLPGTTKDALPLRPHTAGPLTEEGKKAKRLYDEEKWRPAVVALARVASGATGDDLGNCQLAGYEEAIARFRFGDGAGAAHIFAEIARDRSHLRHGETLLWISKIALTVPELTRSLVFYTEDDITKYNNREQRDTYRQLAYLMGRERLERGMPAAAAPLFARVDGPLKTYADKCLMKANEAARANPQQ